VGHGAAPESPAPASVPPSVALRYRGARALLVRGPVTGVGYACYPGDIISAHDGDVVPLVASGAFVRVHATA
jgi:hypothetical protein